MCNLNMFAQKVIFLTTEIKWQLSAAGMKLTRAVKYAHCLISISVASFPYSQVSH
jgi:hypothetical protein